MKRRCCVPECPTLTSKFRRFPKPNGKSAWKHLAFKIWVHRVNNEKLFKGLTEMNIYDRFRLCDSHFSDYCRYPPWNQLITGSLPTLLLPSFSGESNEINSQLALLQNCPDSEEIKMFGGIMLVDRENMVVKKEPDDANLDLISLLTQELASLEDQQIAQPGGEPQKPYFQSVKIFLAENNTLTDVCRICFCPVHEDDVVKLYEETVESDTEKTIDILKQILPDLDLEIYPNSVVCQKCKTLLICSFELRETWQATEDKLQKIVEQEKSNPTALNASLVLIAEPSENSVKQSTASKILVKDSKGQKLASGVEKKTSEPSPPSDVKNSSEQSPDDFFEQYWDNVITEKSNRNNHFIEHDYAHRAKIRPEPETRRAFLCESCGVMLSPKSSYTRHVYRHHHRNRASMCESCGEIFENMMELRRHRRRTHKLKLPQKPPVKRTYKCEFCDKSLTQKYSWKAHIKKMHFNQYNYVQCHLCGKQLAGSSSLRQHLITHNPHRRFSCNICDKKCVTLAGLKKHLYKHSNVKFECEFCGRKIKHEQALKMHIRIYHKNEGKFNCEFCSRPYWKKVDWMKHRIRVHGWAPEKQQTD